MSYNQAEIQRRFIGIARQVADDLLAERSDVLSIYIYGSVGRGEATPESDIDLHVVLDRNETPEPDHEERQVDGVDVGIAYHSKGIYQARLESRLETEAGFNGIARSESIWEIRDAMMLYDEHGLARHFQEQARLVSSLPDVLRARAGFSLQRARQALDGLANTYSESTMGQALVSLFKLTGGGGNTGIAPTLMKTVVQRADLSLTARRIGIRAKVACEKLDRQDLYLRMLDILGFHSPMPETLKTMESAFLAAYDYTHKLVDEAYDPDIPLYQELRQTWYSEGFRSKILRNLREFADLGHPDGTVAFAVGYGPHLLARGDEYPNPWLKQVSAEKLERLVEHVAEIANILPPIFVNLEKRIKQAEGLYEEVAALIKN